MATETYNLPMNDLGNDKNQPNTIQGQYQKMLLHREIYLDRARESSELTIPYLYPPDGNNEATEYATPYQSVGSRGVLSLASKLMLALFPPQAPFFRLDVDELVFKQLSDNPDSKTEIQKGLAKIEKSVMDNIDATNDRVAVYECLKQLIVSGNVLLKVQEEGLKVYRLDNYVISRSPRGVPIKMIIKELIAVENLPEEIANKIPKEDREKGGVVSLYTCIKKEKDGYSAMQEAGKIKLNTILYKDDELPFIPLTFNLIDGMSYGRGLVENVIGDLRSLEGLTKAIIEGSSASSKMLFMVSPNGTTRARSLAKAPNGAIIEGSASDVSVLQANKFNDFRVALETMARIEQRLQFAFLLNSSVQRQAERVTATEIELLKNELQEQLGNVYGILTNEFQIPYLTVKMNLLKKRKLLPELPKDIVKVKILVGLESLGRSSDRVRLITFISDLAQTLGAETLAKHINLDNAIHKFAVANSIDIDGLIKSKEQIADEQNQAYQQQMFSQSVANPQVVTKMAEHIDKNNKALSITEDGNIGIVPKSNQGEPINE